MIEPIATDADAAVAADTPEVRWNTALELGRNSARRCYSALHRQLFPTSKGWRKEFDASLVDLERNLLELWPDQEPNRLRHFIESMRLSFDDERNHNALIAIEGSVIEFWSENQSLEAATVIAARELMSYVDRLDRELRRFILRRDSSDQSVHRFFELGQSLWECVYPFRAIEQFARVQFPRQSSPSRKSSARSLEPRLILWEHAPGTLAVSNEAIKRVEQHLDRVAPPLLKLQRNRLIEMIEAFRGQAPQKEFDAFNRISHRLRECLLPSTDIDEVEWHGIRVNRTQQRVWWEDRMSFQIDQGVPMRLLFLIVKHGGQIIQSQLVEELWSDNAHVDLYKQLRRVRSKLNQVLRTQLGLEYIVDVIRAINPAGGKRLHGPDCRIEMLTTVLPVPDGHARSAPGALPP